LWLIGNTVSLSFGRDSCLLQRLTSTPTRTPSLPTNGADSIALLRRKLYSVPPPRPAPSSSSSIYHVANGRPADHPHRAPPPRCLRRATSNTNIPTNMVHNTHTAHTTTTSAPRCRSCDTASSQCRARAHVHMFAHVRCSRTTVVAFDWRH